MSRSGSVFTAILVCGALPQMALSAPSPRAAQKAPTKKAAPKATYSSAAGGPAFIDNTPLTDDQKIVHVLNRLGFGPRPGDVARVKALGIHRYIALQLTPEKIDDTGIEAKLSAFTLLSAPAEQLTRSYYEGIKNRQKLRQLQEAARRKRSAAMGGDDTMPMGTAGSAAMTPELQAQMRRILQQERNGIAGAARQLQMAKIARAVESERQLQEVLVDFWTNHFNVDIRKGPSRVFKIVDDREVIRPHVLGRFRDLLGASAKSPAMLFYLDNAQSQVPQPVNPRLAAALRRRGGLAGSVAPAPGQRLRGGINENYAREIMELHTLGVDGGYTQKDVQEVARCLTGWGIDRLRGTFQFSPRRHDNGEKRVLGQRIPAGGGIRDGELVLDILASHPSTAKHVSRKLCQRLVADEPPRALVERCAAVWVKTEGDLRAVVRTIVTSNEFFSRAAYRQKIKSPFELAVSAVRALGGTIDLSPEPVRNAAMRSGRMNGAYRALLGQALTGQIATMGQPLYQHQAPTGYPEDSRKWVSAGALISRLNFTLNLTNRRVPGVDHDDLSAVFSSRSEPRALVTALADRLLHGDVSPSTRATLLKQATEAGNSGGEGGGAAAVRRITALVLGSPEFQRR